MLWSPEFCQNTCLGGQERLSWHNNIWFQPGRMKNSLLGQKDGSILGFGEQIGWKLSKMKEKWCLGGTEGNWKKEQGEEYYWIASERRMRSHDLVESY